MDYISNSSSWGFFYFLSVITLSCILIGVGLSVGQIWRKEWAKLTSFECGFEPLSTTSVPFSMRFFVVALLFLIFDVETVLLVPFIYSVGIVYFPMSTFVVFMCAMFILVLLGGLAHEYNEGSLEWVKDI